MQLSDRIKEIRKKNKMTQDNFSQILGIDKSHVSKLETGKAAPSESLIKLICKLFSINEAWLKNGKGNKKFVTNDNMQEDYIESLEFNLQEEKYDNLNLHLIDFYRTLSNSLETFRSLEIHLAANDFSIDMEHPKAKAMENTTRKIKDNMEKLIKILDKIFDNNPNKI